MPYVGLPTSSVYYQKRLFQLCICAQINWLAKISFSMRGLLRCARTCMHAHTRARTHAHLLIPSRNWQFFDVPDISFIVALFARFKKSWVRATRLCTFELPKMVSKGKVLIHQKLQLQTLEYCIPCWHLASQ